MNPATASTAKNSTAHISAGSSIAISIAVGASRRAAGRRTSATGASATKKARYITGTRYAALSALPAISTAAGR